MPNHVENNLNVFGDAQDVQDFRNLFIIDKDGEKSATYNLIHPMPQELNLFQRLMERQMSSILIE